MKLTCWYRQNVNGDLRQFGATKGSKYDCTGSGISSGAGANGCTSNPADTILAAAQSAAEGAGVHRLTTSGVQIYLANAFSTDKDVTLDGGVAAPDISNHSIGAAGTIWTSDTASVGITLGVSATLQNISVTPHWLGQYMYDQTHMPPGSDHLSLPQQQYILSQMIARGQQGVLCGSANCAIKNANVVGYDTAIEVTGGGSSTLEDIQADGDVCAYLHGTGGSTHWGRVDCNTYATKDGVSAELFTVTAVTRSLTRCQLTVTPANSDAHLADLSTGYYVWVAGLDANTGANANGRWMPNSVSIVGTTATVVLNGCPAGGAGTTLNGPTLTGSYTAGTQTIRLDNTATSSAIATIRAGQAVTSTASGVPVTAVVTSIGPSVSCVPPATGTCAVIGISQPLTASASAASITFSSQSFSGGIPTCNPSTSPGGDSTGPCLIITAQERIDAGASSGGRAATGSATGGPGCGTAFLIGGFNSSTAPTYTCQTGTNPDNNDEVDGFDAESPFCFAYAICYHAANAYNVRFLSASMDATPGLGDDKTAFAVVDGGFKNLSFLGGKAGKTGSGLIVNPSGSVKGCVNIESLNLSAFEVDVGCLLGRGLDSVASLTVSDNALAVQVNGYAPNLKLYKQDATDAHLASAITDTSGALQTKLGSAWWGGQFSPGGVAPSLSATGTGGAVMATGNDSVGRFTLGTIGGSITPVLTFSHAWNNTPVCRAWDEASSSSLPVTATASTITIGGTLTSGHTIAYHCIGYGN